MSEPTSVLTRKFELGMVGVVALVALRVGIGWHFFYEGMWKYKHPQEASAANYFKNSKGPFADTFRSMVPDLEGRFRLDRGWFESHLAALRDKAQQHYNFSEDQTRQSKVMLKLRQRPEAVLTEVTPQGFHRPTRLAHCATPCSTRSPRRLTS